MRSVVRAVGWLGLLVTVGLSVLLVGALATHPRDQPAYLDGVHRYGNPDHRVPAASRPPDQVLVQVGDRACEWLEHQPPALWRRSSRYQPIVMASRYASSASDTTILQASGLRPESVYAEAWDHLCPGTVEIVLPHYRALFGGGD